MLHKTCQRCDGSGEIQWDRDGLLQVAMCPDCWGDGNVPWTAADHWALIRPGTYLGRLASEGALPAGFPKV